MEREERGRVRNARGGGGGEEGEKERDVLS